LASVPLYKRYEPTADRARLRKKRPRKTTPATIPLSGIPYSVKYWWDYEIFSWSVCIIDCIGIHITPVFHESNLNSIKRGTHEIILDTYEKYSDEDGPQTIHY